MVVSKKQIFVLDSLKHNITYGSRLFSSSKTTNNQGDASSSQPQGSSSSLQQIFTNGDGEPRGNPKSKLLFDEDRIRQRQLRDEVNRDLNSVGGGYSTGRSLAVEHGRVGFTFRKLNQMMEDNGVKKELRLRRRYEKPTLRRKRERREANSRRFAAAVREKVKLVMKMKNCGCGGSMP
ncbi:hypothetical protein H4219_001737 [Mycoemilia scoparia]|uniref:Uncharacterized protein n=1 Tax=Mycoemilia scoparia TaxID=417184 RepID=A0A9W8A463_9FUNG|nr:hypothetical protein H4219_001737 [Mycoemilia scoparia]